MKHYLKKMLSICPSKKPIISTYPNGINCKTKKPYNSWLKGPLVLEGINPKDNLPRLNVKSRFFLIPKKPYRSHFLAGCFLFGKADLLLQGGLYDPYLPFLFYGEETLLSAKLYTNGWDFFVPNKNVIYL